MKSWIDKEIAGCEFKDTRIGKRFRQLLHQLSNGIGNTIPLACQDWAATKAAYRFLSNESVSEDAILGGHFQSTRARFAESKGPILVLQDTTEFSYKRIHPELIGYSRAVTTDGLPLGLAAVKFWTRAEFKGCNALKRKINPTRVPITEKESIKWLENLKQSNALLNDPDRCIHVGNRESDIYELSAAADELKTHFLVRTCVDRLAGDGCHTIADEIADEIADVKVNGLHRITVRDRQGKTDEALFEIKYRAKGGRE